MRDLFIILVLAEVVLAALILASPTADRNDHAKAVAAYHDQPSQKNLEALQHQQGLSRQFVFHMAVSCSILLAANSCALVYVWRRMKRSRTAEKPAGG
ncbi:MAG: hypothetical protein HZC54_06670 [Verrucomicrobia bacterium]|nr:hypothetical protein [Verrucomicrobiota bacterium]